MPPAPPAIPMSAISGRLCLTGSLPATTGASFIVRIEDTDVTRRVKGAVKAILDSLRWLGLDWDEGPEVGGKYGPYIQSERLDMYRETAERLIAQGDAYYCYCSPQRLEAMRAEQVKRKQPPGYDRCCRNLSAGGAGKERSRGHHAGGAFQGPAGGADPV